MTRILLISLVIVLMLIFISCGNKKEAVLSSPDGKITAGFFIKDGLAKYSISCKNKTIINPSSMGFEFKNAEPLNENLQIVDVEYSSKDETWQPVWGAFSKIRNHYNRMEIQLQETVTSYRQMNILFRVYNDGVGFRYIFPKQENFNDFKITSENTEFRMADNYKTWWQIANYDSYEYTFVESPLSELGAEKHIKDSEYGWPAFGESVPGAANTPVTMQTNNGVYLSIHEADLTNYAGMTLEKVKNKNYLLKSALVPWPDGKIKVKGRTPFQTPWRTIQIGNRPGDLIESKLIVNLNEPCQFKSTEWITPAKYCGVWWSLHLGKESWGTGPKHGANTKNVKRYIDFAAENEILYVLAEGWNKYGPLTSEGGKPDFITPADDFNLEEILSYAECKGVRFMGYNETGCQVNEYRENWDTTFGFYEKNNISAIKAGHVGDRLAKKYHHHSQWGVNYYQDLIDKTAEYHISLMVHEPIKPTGKRRTYPHFLTREGVAGMEQDKFDYADPREHTVEVPFIRMLAGPLDYMPGIFDNKLEDYKGMQVQSTVARQLAYYPIFLSGLQCVTDMPKNYEGKPAFQFIRDVPVGWDETKVIKAEIGDYLSIARRKGDNWFLGTITDEKARKIEIPLDFLGEGKYRATIYSDRENTHAVNNPNPMDIEKINVVQSDTIVAKIVSGGGQALSIIHVPRTSGSVK